MKKTMLLLLCGLVLILRGEGGSIARAANSGDQAGSPVASHAYLYLPSALGASFVWAVVEQSGRAQLHSCKTGYWSGEDHSAIPTTPEQISTLLNGKDCYNSFGYAGPENLVIHEVFHQRKSHRYIFATAGLSWGSAAAQPGMGPTSQGGAVHSIFDPEQTGALNQVISSLYTVDGRNPETFTHRETDLKFSDAPIQYPPIQEIPVEQ